MNSESKNNIIESYLFSVKKKKKKREERKRKDKIVTRRRYVLKLMLGTCFPISS